MSKIKVAYIDHADKVGGAQKSLLGILRKLDRERFEPVLLHVEGAEWASEAESLGATCEPALPASAVYGMRRDEIGRGRLARLRGIAAALGPALRLRRAIRRHGVGLVHTNSLKAALIGGLAAWLVRAPLVWHLRDILPPGGARAVLARAARTFRPKVIAISSAVAATLQETGCHVEVVYNGLELDTAAPGRSAEEVRRELGIRDSAPLVSIVARLTPWKRHEDLLRAMAMDIPPLRRTHLIVAGDARYWGRDYEDGLVRLAGELGIAERVKFVGFREDVYDLLAASDALVLPSDSEPFGRALIEAMAVGTPVIGARSGGVPEIVEHERSGLLVEVGDVEGLAMAMARLLSDADLRRRLGEAGRQRVAASFTLDRTIAGVMGVYEQALRGPGPRG